MKPRSILLAFAATLFGAALCVPTSASAQSALTAGVKGGVNVANVDIKVTSGDLTLSPKRRIGGIGGVFVGADFGGRGGVLAEVLFSQGGTKFSEPESGASFEIRTDYIAVPIVGRVSLKGSDTVKLHIFGGPSFAFKVNDTQKLNGQTVTTADEGAVDLQKYDIGATFGGTLDISRFLVEARYTYGFTNLDKSADDQGQIEVKSRTISFMIGYRFK